MKLKILDVPAIVLSLLVISGFSVARARGAARRRTRPLHTGP
jgi:hypothetical protein